MRAAWIPLALLVACTGEPNPGTVDQDGDGAPASIDCNDADDEIAPGRPERCDGKDNDCNGLVDDDAADATDWFRDVDGDSYGDEDISVRGCSAPDGGFVDNGDDCNDLFDNSYPGADEICDGNDNDCDEEVDEGAIDASEWYRDVDGDGFGVETDTATGCSPPVGYVAGPGDCDDGDAEQNPRASEICNDEDDDCDDSIDEDALDAPVQYVDVDGDGHGTPEGESIQACTPPEGYAPLDDDCDDTEPAAFPGATEVCDGIDNDCLSSTAEDGLVTADGTNAANLETAIASAAVGGTVAVCPGDWVESLTISKTLTLLAPPGGATTQLRPATADTPILTIDSGAQVTVSGLTFAEGDAGTGGAIDATAGGELAVRDCVFRDNVATDGGAIAASTSSTTSIIGSTFTDNIATDRGGALYVGESTIETSTLSGNLATTGGGIYLTGGGLSLDVDSAVDDNAATQDGGGIAIAGANLLTGGALSGNEAGRNGGGVWVDDGGSVTSCEIDANTATGAGGGIYLAGDATLETLFVTDNEAASGAGIATSAGDVDITATSITGNTAVDDGGGIAVLGAGDVVFSGGVLNSNTATSGGGAWLGDGSLESVGSDWGSSSLDNDPDDVAISGGDTYDAYGASASFTCTVTDGTCS